MAKKRIKKILRKVEKKEKKVELFPEKLYNIINDTENESIIHWDESGKIIVIESKSKFSTKILQEYFCHQNYESFIRQLNLYGFNKEPNIYNTNKEAYSHPNFTKFSKPENIKNIKRKKNNEDEDIEINKKIESIEQEKNDDIVIEKYLKLIKDENIKINNKIKLSIINYVNKKNEEIKKKINSCFTTLKFLEIQELFQKDIHNSEKFTPRTAIFKSKNNLHDVKNPMLLSIISNNDDNEKKNNDKNIYNNLFTNLNNSIISFNNDYLNKPQNDFIIDDNYQFDKYME